MPIAVFGSQLTRKDSWQTAFANPTRILTAKQLDEVVEVVEEAEQAAIAGSYVVLMLSYEVAQAFDSTLRTHNPHSFPLAWAAVFSGPVQVPTQSSSNYKATKWEPRVTRAQYDDAVQKIHEFIRAGATYQVNYSFPLLSTFEGDTLDWYFHLCKSQDAAYCVYLDLGCHKVISLSPELFFIREGNKIKTRPMKGTMRRGRWADEDLAYAESLRTSSKDKAENVMIVDLLRNDLGKISVTGSVQVAKLFELERFETLWQMTSTVESTLKDGTSLVDLVRAVFPCGSITGAPKIRTMEIIRELEPFPRGAYTGTIGLIKPGGDCTFNVAIRTITLDSKTGKATFGVGGGITIDSTADREYDECLVKSTFLQRQPIEFRLFESILLEQGQYFLLERHMERLKRSSDYFGFALDQSSLRHSLNDFAQGRCTEKWKVKVELEKNGQFVIDTTAVEAETQVKRVALASRPVDSSNRLLFHKTTAREFYSTELQKQADCDDIIFWNERGEITESSIANVVVRIDDKLYTPSIESGLLAGTFRDELLSNGEIEERLISLEDFQTAQEVFLINSVRKWMRAEQTEC